MSTTFLELWREEKKEMKAIKVQLGDRSYPVYLNPSVPLPSLCEGLPSHAVVITHSKLKMILLPKMKKFFKGVKLHFVFVPPGERSKSASCYLRVLKEIVGFDQGRGITVIALGGGVIGDLAGFAAASYKRGVPLVQVPTTLLSAVDSSVGGKTGINFCSVKNSVGAFYQPRLVAFFSKSLDSLPLREVRCGLSEVIKYGAIFDEKFFSFLEKNLSSILSLKEEDILHIVRKSVSWKAKVVKEDEYDRKGRRALLNFGHSFGHALEASQKRRVRWHHGEAISLGMIAAARLSVQTQGLSKTDADRLFCLLQRTGLPVDFSPPLPKGLWKAFWQDKKFLYGKNRLVLLEKLGKARVVCGVSESVIRKAFNSLLRKKI